MSLHKAESLLFSENLEQKRRGNKVDNSRGWFRSIDLWVMGPARFRCATLLLLTWMGFEHRCPLVHWDYVTQMTIVTEYAPTLNFRNDLTYTVGSGI